MDNSDVFSEGWVDRFLPSKNTFLFCLSEIHHLAQCAYSCTCRDLIRWGSTDPLRQPVLPTDYCSVFWWHCGQTALCTLSDRWHDLRHWTHYHLHSAGHNKPPSWLLFTPVSYGLCKRFLQRRITLHYCIFFKLYIFMFTQLLYSRFVIWLKRKT